MAATRGRNESARLDFDGSNLLDLGTDWAQTGHRTKNAANARAISGCIELNLRRFLVAARGGRTADQAEVR